MNEKGNIKNLEVEYFALDASEALLRVGSGYCTVRFTRRGKRKEPFGI